MVHRRRNSCRACEGDRLRQFLSLGPAPLANAFAASPAEFDQERSYPLDVYLCEDCSLVQLLDVIDPEVLFRNYVYVKATSETIRAHNADYAAAVAGRLGLKPGELVVEVGSNDGSLLRCFQKLGVRALGVDPASNIALMARQDGVETLDWFFNLAAAREIRRQYGPARAVIGNNVLAHVDDPRDFLAGCRELLTDDGQVVIEVPYLKDLLDHLEYDTVYHEHLCYFSINTLARLYAAAGLAIQQVDRLRVHGGSLRIFAGVARGPVRHAAAVEAQAAQERSDELTSPARYERFARDVAESRRTILELLGSLKSQGRSLAAYGAPAKGNTLLNYCRIDTRLVEYTVDQSPLKVGRFTPGMRLPVLPVSTLVERQPDYVLILAWNFAEEIIRQQAQYRARGGRFITPIPTARVL